MKNIPEILNKIVKKVCDQKNITDFEIILEGGNAKGEGFLGEIVFLSVINKETHEKLQIVIKKAFASETIRLTVPIRDSFLNEINFYVEIWPKLNQFQTEANVSKKFGSVANCFAVSKEDGREFLVLENLKSLNFEMFEKTDTLTDNHIRNIFNHYSKFHALSLAYRDCHPEKYSRLCDNLIGVYEKFLNGPHFGGSLTRICEKSLATLQPDEDDNLIKEFQKYVEMAPTIFRESLKYEGKNACILQGDCWSNNMLFKYDDSRKLTDIRMIDWQLIRSGSPVHDLSYCLYSGASKDVYQNLDEYLKMYYDNFESFYKELTGRNCTFSLEDLKEDWKKYSKFGLLMSLLVIKMKLTDKSDIKDLTDLKDGDLDSGSVIDARFNEIIFADRVRDLLRHFKKIGAL